MCDWRRGEQASFSPLRQRIAWLDPLPDIVFRRHHSRFFARRNFRHEEPRIESTRHKRRRYPSTDIDQRLRIELHPDFFEDLSRRAHPIIFLRIELPTRERIEPA